MPRIAKPWYRESHNAWYCKHEGQQVVLARGPKAATEAAARQAFHALKAGQGTVQPDTGIALGKLGADFLEHVRAERKASTHRWYANVLGSFLLPRLAQPALSITPHDVLVWARAMGTSANYRRNNIAAVKAMFAWGLKVGLLPSNPVAQTPKPPATRRKVIPSRADIDEILKETAGTPLGDLLVFLAETGCRLQDARRLEARHIRWEQGIAILDEHKTDTTGKPKVIPLTDVVLTLLQRLARTVPVGPLLRNTRGKPWTQSAVSQTMQHVRERLGYGPEMTPHAFRHRFATTATRVLPRPVVAALMGYSSTEMIDRIYDHTQDDLAEDAAELRKAVEQARRGDALPSGPATRPRTVAPPAARSAPGPASPPDDAALRIPPGRPTSGRSADRNGNGPARRSR